MIGCTILRAVSGILLTHRGRRWSGLRTRRQLAVATCAGLVRRGRAGYRLLWPLRLRSSPGGSPLRPCGSPLSHLAGVGQCPLAIGHGCLVGLLVGVLDRRHCRLRRRAVGQPWAGTAAGRSPTAPCTLTVWCQWRRPLPVRVQLGRHRVADRQRRAASPVSGIQD